MTSIDSETLLGWLHARRSTRKFTDRPVPRAVLERVVEAATTAPSSSNRQPWRYSVVSAPKLRAQIVAAVRDRTVAIKDVIRRGAFGEELAAYSDFFFEPLDSASVIIVPQYREFPDQIEHLLTTSGANAAEFARPAQMPPEVCGASASVMLLLLQARAEGLGACWMAGPTVARPEIEALLDVRPPFRMLGAIALGWPAEEPVATTRRAVEKVTTFWYEGDGGSDVGNR